VAPNPSLASYTARPSRRNQDLERHSRRPFRGYPAGVIRLDSGDSDLESPQPIRDAMTEALDQGLTHYGPPMGDPDLREMIASTLSAGTARSVGAEQVLITHGACAALAAGLLATLDPGDRVLILDPCYPIFPDLVRLAGAEPVLVPHRPDLHIDVDAVTAAAVSARALIVCNPCSPTGIVYAREELEALALVVESADLLVFGDEVYDRIVFDNAGFTSLLELPQLEGRLLLAQSFSKTYAMAGWRIGYLVAPRSLFRACAGVHRTLNGPINTAVQRAAMAALSLPPHLLQDMLHEYQARRDLVLDALAGVPGTSCVKPEATFFAWVRHPAARSDAIVGEAIQHGVSVRSGSEFGLLGEGHLAISFSIDRHRLAIGLDRLVQVLSAANQVSAEALG
jgi:aspartate/methionine/tyrosine aminotransferase